MPRIRIPAKHWASRMNYNPELKFFAWHIYHPEHVHFPSRTSWCILFLISEAKINEILWRCLALSLSLSLFAVLLCIHTAIDIRRRTDTSGFKITISHLIKFYNRFLSISSRVNALSIFCFFSFSLVCHISPSTLSSIIIFTAYK